LPSTGTASSPPGAGASAAKAASRDCEDDSRSEFDRGRISVKMKDVKNSREILRLKLFFIKNISLLLYKINYKADKKGLAAKDKIILDKTPPQKSF
jgi:hypothetical protein